MASNPKPKAGGARNDSRPNGKKSKSGNRSSKPTGDLLNKGFETKFLNACREGKLMKSKRTSATRKSKRDE